MAQKKLYRALLLAVMIAVLTVIFALSAVAEIEGGNGVITGLDNGSYEAAPVTLNSTGDGYTVGEYTAVDSTTTGLAGLYDVRPSGDETEGLVNLVYVNGPYADRSVPYTTTVNTQGKEVLVYASSADFVVGSWNSSSNRNISGGASFNSTNNRLSVNTSYLVAKSDMVEYWILNNDRTVAVEKFSDAALTEADVFYDKYYGFTETEEEVKDEETGETSTVTVKTYNTELNEVGTARKAELEETFEANLESVRIKYAYPGNQMIPVSSFNSFSFFEFASDFGLITSAGQNRQVIIYVMNETGEVLEHTWTSDVQIKLNSGTSVTVNKSAISDFPENGWIVGLEIIPYLDVDPTSFVINGSYSNKTNLDSHFRNASYGMNFSLASYSLSVPQLSAPTGLWADGNEIKGLDENSSYTFTPYTIAGLVEDEVIALEAGNTSCAGLTAGIWAVTVESAYGSESAPAYVYVDGLYSDKSDIFTVDTATNNLLYATDSTNEKFVPGTILLPSGVITRGGSAYAVAFGYSGFSEVFKNATDEKKVELFNQNITQYQTYRYAYGFNSDEIVPISEVQSYTWALAQRYMPFGYNDLESKFIAHIMDENGSITEYEYLHAPKNFTGGFSGDNINTQNLAANASYNKIVDFTQTTSENGAWTTSLPAEGYLVGFEIIPLWGMTDYSKVTSTCTTGNLTQVNIYVYNNTADYLITKPAVDTPTGLALNGNKITGLDPDKNYVAAPYSINGIYGDEISLDSTTELSGGLWAVYFPATDETAASDCLLFYVKPDYETRHSVGEINADTGKSLYVNGADTWSVGYFTHRYIHGADIVSNGIHSFNTMTLSSANNSAAWDALWEIKTLETELANLTDETEIAAKQAQIAEKRAAFASSQVAADIISELAGSKLRYAYKSEEILPVAELETITLGVYINQTRLGFKYSPAFTISVMDANGVVTEYSHQYSEVYQLAYGVGLERKLKFNLKDIENLPEEGWVVGFELAPFASVLADNIYAQTEAGSFYDSNVQFRLHATNTEYVIRPDAKPTSYNLVLDGQIGIKFTVEDITADDVLGFANFSAGEYAAPEFVFDETTGSATAILYVAPKDASDLIVSTDITLNGSIMLDNIEVSVPGYVEDNKDSEGFEEVKPLLEAIDTYCEYADNYFNEETNVLEEVILDAAEKEELAKPINAKRNGNLNSVGLEFNSTSLILEETVTIRHYFKVVDADKFAKAGSHNLMKYSDTIYYIDVANIAAHELSTAMEAHVIGGADEMTISFSVVDYVKLTWSNENDVKLSNLAKALYKYSVKADAYKKATAK